MNTAIVTVISEHIGVKGDTGYVIGAIIALFILGYLLYTLIRAEKF